jgi:flagellar biosynthesis protein FlhF
MRLKAFTAATLAEAMQQVRDALGDNATVMLTEQKENGTRIVVSYDPDEPRAPAAPPPVAAPEAESEPEPAASSLTRRQREWLIADPGAAQRPAPATKRPAAPAAPAAPAEGPTLAEIFDHHGVPDAVLSRLGPLAATTSLAERLEAAFRFAGLADAGNGKPILLAGPPGSGKTLAAAKLAARGVIGGMAVRLISTDTQSAGALEQLKAFTRPLGLEVEGADGAVGLATLLTAKPVAAQSLVIIDTQGINPFDRTELANLGAQIVSVRADPVLVLAAGGDARESGEIAEAFARVGCSRFIATRLDLARRLGGLMAAAGADLAFTEMSASPMVAHGFQPLSATALARLLVNGIQAPA